MSTPPPEGLDGAPCDSQLPHLQVIQYWRTSPGTCQNPRLPGSFLLLCNQIEILCHCLQNYLFVQVNLTLDQLLIISHYLYRRPFHYKGLEGPV